MSALSNSTCPVCRTADVVCGKWTLLIRDLAEGSSRFCELERSLEGISPRTLSLRLRALEEEGSSTGTPSPRCPPAGRVRADREGRGAGAADRGHAPLRQALARLRDAEPRRRGLERRRPAVLQGAVQAQERAGRKPGACVTSSSTKR